MQYRIAQVNIGRIKASLDEPVMEGFVGRLAEINALADHSPAAYGACKPQRGTPPTCAPMTTTEF